MGLVPAVPLLPIVQAVTVRVGGVRRAVGGQAVLLQPGVGDKDCRRLELVGAHVHRATGDARVTIEIWTAGADALLPALMQGELDCRRRFPPA